MPKREMHPNSLYNLHLGRTPTENKRMTFVVYPDQIDFLSGVENKSKTVNDALDFYERCEYHKQHFTLSEQQEEDLAILQDQVKGLRKQVGKLEDDILNYRDRCRDQEETIDSLLSDNMKAANILKAALKLPANIGGKIKTAIRQALPLLDDEWDKSPKAQAKELGRLYQQQLKR